MTARPSNKSVKEKGHLGGLTPAENIRTMGRVRKGRLPLTYGTEGGISVVFPGRVKCYMLLHTELEVPAGLGV